MTLLDDPARPDPLRIATRKDFGRELTLVKDASGHTVRRLAGELGVPPSTLGGYFAGTHLPGLHPPGLLLRLLQACGVADPGVLEEWHRAYWRVKRAADEHAGQGSRGAGPDQAGSAEPSRPPLLADGSRLVSVSTRPPLGRVGGDPEIRGRDALVGALAGVISGASLLRDEPSIHVLHGLGGCGKSTVALATARAAMAAGVRTWWLVADDVAVLTAGMLSIAMELGADPDELRLGSLQDIVWRLLGGLQERWLLVLDNADDPPGALSLNGRPVTDGTGWLRDAGRSLGTVVVTSCDRSESSWGAPPPPWLALHEVECLPPDLGADLLIELTGQGGDLGAETGAAMLAERLGGLPLALVLAGRYLAEIAGMPGSWITPDLPRGFGGYAQALDRGTEPAALLATAAATPPTRPEHMTVSRTWELSLDLLADRGLAEARRLLQFLACLGSAPVPYELVLNARAMSASPLFGTLSPRLVWETLRGLEALGLLDLTTSPAGEANGEGAVRLLVLHPVVRDVSRWHADVRAMSGDFVALAVALLDSAVEDADPKHPQDWARWSLLTDHCAAPLDLIDDHGLQAGVALPSAVDLANRAAGYLRAVGQLGRSEAAYAQAGSTAARVLRPEDPRLLTILHDTARLHYDQGRLREAEQGFREVLDLRQRHLGRDHPDTLTSRHHLARTLLARGVPTEAGALFESTFRTRSAVLGETHPDTLTSHHGIADQLSAEGDHRGARQVYERVLASRTEHLGPGHPATLVTRHYLARTRYRLGEHTEVAGELRALADTNSGLRGADHPRTLSVLGTLADLLHDSGQLDEARELAASLVERRRRLLGNAHRATLASRYRLGLILFDLGDVDHAEETLADVLVDRQRTHGLRHPDTVMTRETLAAVRRRRP
ncbi:tetratricopeptide repeat protein [Streptomyces spongiicola]|uniref:tetratricopeptide repeat protein n=1 Tax=Streptomyces spongiicola TaxID=1690221 RepID=UPI00155847DE|nr:tetratricopeptide repeat protein [Streptomyces spongiicola]